MHNPNNALMMMSIFTRDAKRRISSFGLELVGEVDKNNYKYKNWLTGETNDFAREKPSKTN